MASECLNRKIERGESPGVWIVDGERYVAASVCGHAALLPVGRPLVLQESAGRLSSIRIDRDWRPRPA